MHIVQKPNKFSATPEKRLKSPRLYVPVSLSDDALLAQAGIKPLLRDKYKYFLHVLYLRRVMNRNMTRREMVELNYKYFENYVGKKLAAPIIDFWIAQGVVETPGSYQVGVRCKAYRFTEQYQDDRAVDVGFVEDKFEKKVMLLKKKESRGTLDMTKIQNVFLQFNLSELRVDLVPAQLEINQRIYMAGLVNDTDTQDKCDLDTIAIHAIAEEPPRAHRDEKGHRLHTNFTNLSKYMRKHLYIETGEVLRNLDVSNSQPLFLCVLLMQHVKQMEQDMLDYIQHCETGQLYEKMMVEMGHNPKDKQARDRMKKRLFKCVFYGQNASASTYKEWAVFSSMYKSVAEFITQAKKTDHRSLSHRMQKAEAALILDTVIKQIAEAYHPSDFFATTIHDSIVTTESNAPYVKELMTQAFAQVGLRVNINDEAF